MLDRIATCVSVVAVVAAAVVVVVVGAVVPVQTRHYLVQVVDHISCSSCLAAVPRGSEPQPSTPRRR